MGHTFKSKKKKMNVIFVAITTLAIASLEGAVVDRRADDWNLIEGIKDPWIIDPKMMEQLDDGKLVLGASDGDMEQVRGECVDIVPYCLEYVDDICNAWGLIDFRQHACRKTCGIC